MNHSLYNEPGIKEVVRDKQAVCSSSHPLVTQTVLDVMKNGGNAVDAAVAGSLLEPVLEPHLTSHGGSVSFLFWEARTRRVYQLNGTGTLVPDLAPFRPLPVGLGGFVHPSPKPPPCACIPGFMPGLQAMHERFGSMQWSELCQPAIHWAEEGHPVSSFEYGVLQWSLPANTYFPSGRGAFTPDGFTPHVGQRFKRPILADTLRRLAKEGPQYFTTGDWARHFLAEANRLGWDIKPEHMTANQPRWQEPLRYRHNGHEVIQLAPPETVGLASALVLGILSDLDLGSTGHYTESAQGLYWMAHALRRAAWEIGMLNDPALFEVPTEVLLSPAYQRAAAAIVRNSAPKVDLTEHIRVTAGNPAMVAAGLPTAGGDDPPPSLGSCELSIADPQGNWVQMLNTVQTGGIPGAVIDGVPMWGSHAHATMASGIAGWMAPDSRIRCIIGNTLVLKDGQPWLALGTPGYPTVTVPQLLWSILDAGMPPPEAAMAPRIWPLGDDYTVQAESRISDDVVAGMARLGIRVKPLPPHDWHLGSFQVSWRDEDTGLLNACADPRRTGQAGGF
jgi:gamma-glutamyltranspeptidase/glutathione hydrolase